MEQKENRFEITTRTGEVLTLNKERVEKYLANGQTISDSEFTMFFQLCKVHKVNPFLKEAYIVKYGSSPATIILDYKVLQQCAEEHPQFLGMTTGVLVVDKNGEEKERKGSYLLPNEILIAGWCEVVRNDRNCPTKVYAMFDEFKQFKDKKTGELNANWSGKPVFMITKVAKAQALREAFPNMFGSNVYTQEEATTFEKNADFINANYEEVKDQVEKNVGSEDINSKFDEIADEVIERENKMYSKMNDDIYD